MEQNTKKHKTSTFGKFLVISIGLFVGLVVFVVIINLIFGDEIEQRNVERQKTADSLKVVEKRKQLVQDSIYEYRSKFDKKFKDSIVAVAKETERIGDSIIQYKKDLDKVENPEEYISIEKQSWELGGFGSVAFASFTIKNESLKDVADIVVKFEFKGESMTVLRSTERMIPVIVKKGTSKVIKKENIGFIPNGAEYMTTSFVRANKIL
jgi:hypothetical protein